MTRMLVLVAGLAGFAIVGKAAVYYRGVDGLAFGLTLLMGGALLAGLVELWRTASRVAELHGGLRGALAKADERPESLDAMPAPLRPVLRAHLERDPMPPRAPVFAPYLVGALVLLGLLGTFLGLFETLRGAREALSTSADVDALRAGLSQPMRGLMRSFGTSAAGVAASAMLGLGAVFVRRAARRFDDAVHAACAGPLAHLSAARRQLVALEALAEQGRAWPDAVESLRAAVASLEGLGDAHRTAHRELSEASARDAAELKRATRADAEALLGKLDGLGERWDAAQQEAVRRSAERDEAQREALRQLAAQLEEAHREGARESRDATRRALGEVGERLVGVSDRLAGLDGTQRDAVEQLAERWEAAHARSAEGLREAAEAAAGSVGAKVAELAERLDASVAATTGQLAALEARQQEREEAAEAKRAEAVEAVVDVASRELGGAAGRLEALAASWREAHAEAARAQSETLAEAVASVERELSAAVGKVAEEAAAAAAPALAGAARATADAAAEHLRALRGTLEEEAEARREAETRREAAAEARQRALLEAFEAEALARGEADALRARGFGEASEALLARLDAEAEARRADAAALLGRIEAEAGARREAEAAHLEKVAARLEALGAELRQRDDAAAEREGQRAEALAALAAKVEAELGAASAALRAEGEEAAERAAAQDARAREVLDALGGAAGTVGDAAARQAQALEGLVDEARERLVEAESRTAAKVDALLAKVADAVEAQRARLADLETALAERHESHVRELSEAMLERTEKIGEGLAETGAIVRDAATLVQSSGAELGAAVEMFTAAVEQHGEAAQRWLEGLGHVEHAVEEAGEGAAVDVLGQYLARTHELFDQQLGFQQELVDQLRVSIAAKAASKAAAAAAAGGVNGHEPGAEEPVGEGGDVRA
ncbi:MAG TPA: hypothetical protein RMH85_09810 [Polyangiaceae bacterium LLY-WYZ-15_(1-7)]|nr:hypothetical protein [Polyangiaceae bacterium LLY-WYZ-15_(1-7)]HJL08784.1 hypothetical protein [Polyangiaceae bacterium LLY-WYZ-15_(1-7)]